MAENILVTLKRDDKVGEIVPYIEEVAKPGTKVVFLVHCPVTAPSMDLEGMLWLQTMQSGAEATMAVKALGQKYSWEEDVRLAARKVLPACEGLRKKGVEIDIKLYEGSLRKAVRSYTRNGGVQLIMTRPGIGLRIMNFLQMTVGLFGLPKQPSFSPVLLFHPNPQV